MRLLRPMRKRRPPRERSSRPSPLSGACRPARRTGLLILLATGCFGLLRCGSDVQHEGGAGAAASPQDGCERDGVYFAVGDVGWLGECLFCDCMAPGELACSDECQPCSYGGVAYEYGETFPADDGCNECQCETERRVSCTQMACPECTVGDQSYATGSVFSVGSCNDCRCVDVLEPEAAVVCAPGDCDVECTYLGMAYPAGESFPDWDGCNECTCAAGGSVSCTEQLCPCSPEQQWHRSYVQQEPGGICIGFDGPCPEGASPFGNECGCGCEQDLACPEWFDCSGPDPCDAAALQAQCPYSRILS